MARQDIQIKDVGGKNTVQTRVFKTEAGATAIKLGEFVKLKTAGSAYVIPLADADGVIDTMTRIVGLAAGDSNHTASADGQIAVYMPSDNYIYRAKAKTASDIDTVAKLNGKLNDRVIIDLTGGTYTIDTGAADTATSPFVIVGGDIVAGTVDFVLRNDGTLVA